MIEASGHWHASKMTEGCAMAVLQWVEDLNTGIEEIDIQHRRIVDGFVAQTATAHPVGLRHEFEHRQAPTPLPHYQLEALQRCAQGTRVTHGLVRQEHVLVCPGQRQTWAQPQVLGCGH